jgi:hypothetical protein
MARKKTQSQRRRRTGTSKRTRKATTVEAVRHEVATPAGDDAIRGEITGGDDGAQALVVDRVEAALSPTDIVSLGHSFRRVTGLIEEVGRTLEAQNQRAQRLMERMEGLARTLEVMPQEAERQLEALDAVQRTIERTTGPTEKLRREIGKGLPDVAKAVREGGSRLERRWTATTEAMVKHLSRAQTQSEQRLSDSTRQCIERLGRAQQNAEMRAEQRLESMSRSHRKQVAVLASFAGALVLAIAAILLLQGGALLGGAAVSADEGPPQWRVTHVDEGRDALPAASEVEAVEPGR